MMLFVRTDPENQTVYFAPMGNNLKLTSGSCGEGRVKPAYNFTLSQNCVLKTKLTGPQRVQPGAYAYEMTVNPNSFADG